jgi:hypothetical protein
VFCQQQSENFLTQTAGDCAGFGRQATLFLLSSQKPKKTLPQASTSAQEKTPTTQTLPFVHSVFSGEALRARAQERNKAAAIHGEFTVLALYAACCEWLADCCNGEQA